MLGGFNGRRKRDIKNKVVGPYVEEQINGNGIKLIDVYKYSN